ncbi:MAG: YncE family protein, partial [Acidimicrobiales bacterium]
NPPAVILTDEAGRTRSSVALAGPASHIEGRGPGGGFLAAIESPGTVAVIGEGGGKAGVVAGVTGQPAQTASADGKVFVIDRSSSKVTVVDAAGIVGSVGIGFQPDAVATDGRRLAVVGTQERTIEVLDASNDKSLGRVPAGSGPTQVVGSNSYFYVVDTAGNRILVFASIPSVRQIASYRLAGSPYAVAIDRVHHNLWVTLTATNELAQFQVSNGALRLVDTYSTVRQPNSVAVDPVRGWVFVAGNYGGTVEIIHPPKSAPQ